MTMRFLLSIALAGVAWCQSPGVHGRSANMHTAPQRPGYLGAGVVEVTPERAKALKLTEAAGVEVKRVEENSAAAKAGLKVDDVILELNGQKVESMTQFIGTIGVAGQGAKMALTVWREGTKLTLNATLEERPAATIFAFRSNAPMMPPVFEIMPLPNPIVGIEGETLTPQLAAYFGVKEGVLVMTVMPKTPAEKAGLKAGDVIVKVAGMPVTSIREVSGIVRAAHKTAVFTVVRNHKEIALNVELALDFEPWQIEPGQMQPRACAVNGLYSA
jgi:serine protease Do